MHLEEGTYIIYAKFYWTYNQQDSFVVSCFGEHDV